MTTDTVSITDHEGTPIVTDPATGPEPDTDKTASLRIIAETRPASAAQ